MMGDVVAHMRGGQLLMIRSTVFPGVTDRLGRTIGERGPAVDIAYCPERISEGYALEELTRLPQLVSGVTPGACRRAAEFFAELGARVIALATIEAELAKLFTNSYRYINFAISNQFYMMAERFGADFMRIHAAVTADYPRMAGFARSGFTGGPCLLKDTMQLASFNHNVFALGQTAMMVNEGLPSFLVERLSGHAGPGPRDGGDPGHGVQGRLRRSPQLAGLQAPQDPLDPVPPRALHRPVHPRSRVRLAGNRRGRIGRADPRGVPRGVSRSENRQAGRRVFGFLEKRTL